MGCNCIAEVDQLLDEKQGGKLQASIVFPRNKPNEPRREAYLVPYIGIVRKDTGRLETRTSKARSFFPTFCPFCGVRYEPIEAPKPPKAIQEEEG